VAADGPDTRDATASVVVPEPASSVDVEASSAASSSSVAFGVSVSGVSALVVVPSSPDVEGRSVGVLGVGLLRTAATTSSHPPL